ncbi:MAG: type II 3-dehydroquinate dehydratase [Oscillospiraceae bacterium]
MKFLVLNGPNLNLLGSREPDIYGREDYPALCRLVEEHAAENGSTATCLQSNHEGALVDEIQNAAAHFDAVILNPGAYTHYSYAIYDAIRAVDIPVFEVHISDIQTREDFRKISVTAPACVGQICGQGLLGYTQAMDYFLKKQ